MFYLACGRLAVLAGLAGFATYAAYADCEKKVNLTPTAVGALEDASGKVDLRAQGTDQRFKLSMDAAVPNGSIFVVSADNLVVGAVRIRFNEGELDINTKDGGRLPQGLGPVCGVSSVSVSDAKGNVVLTGSF